MKINNVKVKLFDVILGIISIVVIFYMVLGFTYAFLTQHMYYKYKYIAYDGDNKLTVSRCFEREQAKLCYVGDDYELVDYYSKIRIGKSKNIFVGIFQGYDRIDGCRVNGDKEMCFWIWEEAIYD